MSFEILEEKNNPVVGRKETKLLVHHQGAGTPDRLTVRKLASDHFKTPIERVFVRSISTRTGASSALCAVDVYENAGLAQRNTPAYLKNRNLPKDQRVSRQKKTEEAKPPPPPKKAEQKAEAKPEPAKETKPASESAPRPVEKPSKPTAKPEPKPKS